MRLTCAQESLAKSLSMVGRAVPGRSPLPVLGNVLLATDGDRLKLAATNLEIGITCWTAAKIESEGAITIPARLLTEFVNSLPSDTISLAVRGNQSVNLKCSSFEANMKGMDAEEFPPIPRVDDQATVSVAPELLQSAIQQVVFAAATDDSRPVLAGVLFRLRDSALTLAAADGFRLAVRTIEASGSSTNDAALDVIVPARATQELARIIGDTEEPVEITVTPNRSQILFRVRPEGHPVELVSRLIEGNFPNYQQIIPTRFATRVVIPTKQFQSAAKLASFFARDSSNIVKLNATPGADLTPGRLMVSATSAELGNTEGGIDAAIEGEETQIAFNAKYLSDVIGVIDTEQLSLELNTSSSPGVVRPVGSDDYVHVIMPMYLSNKT